MTLESIEPDKEEAITYALQALGDAALASLRGELPDGTLVAANIAIYITGDPLGTETAIRDASIGNPVAIKALEMSARLDSQDRPENLVDM